MTSPASVRREPAPGDWWRVPGSVPFRIESIGEYRRRPFAYHHGGDTAIDYLLREGTFLGTGENPSEPLELTGPEAALIGGIIDGRCPEQEVQPAEYALAEKLLAFVLERPTTLDDIDELTLDKLEALGRAREGLLTLDGDERVIANRYMERAIERHAVDRALGAATASGGSMMREVVSIARNVCWISAHVLLFLAEVALRGAEQLAAGVERWMTRLDKRTPRLHPREAMLAQDIARIMELDARIEATYARPKKARLRRRSG